MLILKVKPISEDFLKIVENTDFSITIEITRGNKYPEECALDILNLIDRKIQVKEKSDRRDACSTLKKAVRVRSFPLSACL